MANNQTFLTNIDTDKVTQLLNDTESNVSYFNDITESVVKSYTNDLDNLMISINNKLAKDISIDELEKDYLSLTSILYFMGGNLEQLGIRNDISKAARQEVFNKAYIANLDKDCDKKNKTTVAENTAQAEQSSQYESVINSIYDRAYRQVKYKIDAGYEMINTLRKVITKRLAEMDLSKFKPRQEIIED